jgi:N-acetylglucosamine-6-phosphate deacetylase
MAALYPAMLAQMETKGKVEAGYNADLIIFDQELNHSLTIYKGEPYHNTLHQIQ